MKASQMKEAIERAKASLAKGGDPGDVLTTFASEVQGCSGCGESDLCFRCKLTDTLGERAALALPFLIPQVAGMIKEWHAERVQKKAAQKPRGRPGWDPGSEKF